MGLSTPPTAATAKGTLAHHVFERIFDHPREERKKEVAMQYLLPAWQMMIDPLRSKIDVKDPSEIRLRDAAKMWREEHTEGSTAEIRLLREAVDYRSIISENVEESFLKETEDCILGWYNMENPEKFDPMEREFYVAAELAGVNVHGYIDRLDRIETANGPKYYISDYKTGRPPGERFQAEAFFQLAVYALLFEKQLGIRPFQLRLIYVREGRSDAVLTQQITPAILAAAKKKIADVWRDIQRASETSTWEPRKQTLCGWCFFQSVCPAYDPSAEALTAEELAARTGARLG